MPKPTTRTDQIAALYGHYARELEDSVTARVHTDDRATIEDACAFAWTVLIDRPDVSVTRRSVRGWLYVTACRQAIRLRQRAAARPPPTTAGSSVRRAKRRASSSAGKGREAALVVVSDGTRRFR